MCSWESFHDIYINKKQWFLIIIIIIIHVLLDLILLTKIVSVTTSLLNLTLFNFTCKNCVSFTYLNFTCFIIWTLFPHHTGNGTWFPVPNSGIVPPKHTDQPGKRLWLFNIADDPNEYKDLSEYRPDVVMQLFNRLQEYYTDSVEPFYPAGDPRADPARHNDTWSDWE